MALQKKRGVNTNQEVSSRRIYRDTTPNSVKTLNWLRGSFGASSILFGAAMISFVIPGTTETLVMISGVVLWLYIAHKATLPFKMPIYSGLKDKNDPHPATKKPQDAAGMFFLGNDEVTKEELWLAKPDYCTHTLMLATTGGGKTEALISMALNSLAQGSGFLFVDGKADVSLLLKIYSMVRMCGREDDLLVVNYNTGGTDVSFDTPDQKISNTLNPFSFGSSSSLTQLLVSLMSDSGGKGDFWKDRAISLVEAIIPALVWMRDKRGLLLDVSVIREYLNLGRIVELRKITAMPMNIQESLRAYCENLAGWQERKGAAQGDTTMEQHGYLQMQFTRTLGSLGDVYGHIFRTSLGEVDMYDVVTNRRILLVMLPALEKSPPELANLGRIIVALIKSMMAAALGSRVEGDVQKVVKDRFTNSDTPYQTIFDEYGYYSVDGSAVMPAQARSLNIGMVFAGQDYASFKKSSEENARSIISNCNIKVFGKVEDGDETFSLYKNLVGEIYVTNTGGYKQSTGFLGGYNSSEDASIQSVSRANILDLKEKGNGQMNVLFKSQMIEANMFYANPPEAKILRVNEFIRIKAPSEEALSRIDDSMNELIDKLKSEEFSQEIPSPAKSLDIEFMSSEIKRHQDLDARERSAAVIASYHVRNLSQMSGENAMNAELMNELNQVEDNSSEEGSDEFEEQIFNQTPRAANVFSKTRNSEVFNGDLSDLDAMTGRMIEKEHAESPGDKLIAATIGEGFSQEANRSMAVMSGLLDEESVHESLVEIETQMGKSPAEAAEAADVTVQNMETLTDYPKSVPQKLDSSELVEALDILEEFIAFDNTEEDHDTKQ